MQQIEIDSFNICIENIDTPASNSTKRIFSLQISLQNCRFKADAHNGKAGFVNEECKISHMKTNELLKLFAGDKVLVDDTFEEESDSLSQDDHKYKYLLRVVHLGQVHSLVNSQFKTKLRADMRVELVEVDMSAKRPPSPQSFVIAMMSKFLFYYSFMRLNACYTLTTSERLSVKKDTSMSMLVLDDSMRIDLDIEKSMSQYQKFLNLLNSSINSKQQAESDTDEFLNSLTGVLVEKKLLENTISTLVFEQRQLNESLTSQFDLMVPNRSFKLVIRLNDDSSTFITVYHDTRYSIYPLSILPGN
jgi:hypothetical protein